MTKIVKVLVEQQVSDNELHDDDLSLGLPSEVEILVKDEVPENHLANCALDVFHDSFPIKVLDDFELSVEYQGNLIEQDLNIDSYFYSGMGDLY